MLWTEVESLLVANVRQRFSLQFQQNPQQFTDEFGTAYNHLRDLNKNPNYTLPLIGEAYCLKYHLLRMDNVSVALSYIHYAHQILQTPEARVLDVGGGTGGSTMAFIRWASSAVNLTSTNISVTCAEPSDSMRTVAYRLIPSLRDYLSTTIADFRNAPITGEILNASLEDCAEKCRKTAKPVFDLIIFSYALWKQPADEWPKTVSLIFDIARTLKPGGVLMFLSPKSPLEKVRFMEHLTAQLKAQGFKQLSVHIPRQHWQFPNSTSCAPVKHPDCLKQLLHEINDTCFTHTGIYPLEARFGGNPDDYPYYGFYGTLEAFTHP